MKIDIEKNARLDLRHRLGDAIDKPRIVDPKKPQVKLYRCYMREGGCGKLVTEWEPKNPKHNGGCPHCGCHYVVGGPVARPRGREWLRIFWLGLIRHWSMWGPPRKGTPWYYRSWGWSWPKHPVRSFLKRLFGGKSIEEVA